MFVALCYDYEMACCFVSSVAQKTNKEKTKKNLIWIEKMKNDENEK